MKVAVLADLHGNSDALDAVMADPEFADIEHLFILGDIVGYYYHPDRVMERLESFPSHWVQGNHDAMLSGMRDTQSAHKIRRKYGSAHERALDCLSEVRQVFLTNAPPQQTVVMDGLTILLCHGSPWDRDRYVYPDATGDLFDRCAAYQVDVVLMGHTHYPMLIECQGKVLANPGSVGQARDKGGRACWLKLDTETRVFKQQYTPYDPARLIEEIQRFDPGMPYLTKALVRS